MTSAALLGCAASTQAAIFVGTWDPAYGAWFPNLGWEGESQFFIPDACVVSNGTVTQGGCAGMSAGVAQVNLYALDNISLNETLNFNQLVNVSSMIFAGGLLTGVNADFFAPEVASLGAAGGGQFEFSLRFSTDGARLFHLDLEAERHINGNGIGHIEHGNGNGYGHYGACPFPPSLTSNTQSCGFSDTYGLMRFSLVRSVAEPQAVALLLAGLGALGFTARRRRR